MTLQEAIKSGKRFKRPGFEFWLGANSVDKIAVCVINMDDTFVLANDGFMFNKQDLMADDWYLLEKDRRRIKKYLWNYQSIKTKMLYISTEYFADKDDLDKFFPYDKSAYKVIGPALWSELECKE